MIAPPTTLLREGLVLRFEGLGVVLFSCPLNSVGVSYQMPTILLGTLFFFFSHGVLILTRRQKGCAQGYRRINTLLTYNMFWRL